MATVSSNVNTDIVRLNTEQRYIGTSWKFKEWDQKEYETSIVNVNCQNEIEMGNKLPAEIHKSERIDSF